MSYRSFFGITAASLATLLGLAQQHERRPRPSSVHSLRQKWTARTQGDVSATPTVAADAVYSPDWAGNLYAVRKEDGGLIWSHKISEYDGVFGSLSRVTPALYGDNLILGDIQSTFAAHSGASIMSVDRHTGALKWITQIDSHPAAIITGPAVLLGDAVYVGVSSNEENLANNASYRCCTFRGSVVALNANDGMILWKTNTIPPGYSGGAVWQQPAVDAARGSLYVGTGNNYSVPSGNLAPDDYFDTALALDLKTGKVKWARRLQGFDVWTVACLSQPPGVNCPSPSSPDYDLGGSGPNLLPNMVGFGQKSGIYWSLNPDTGEIVWSTVVGPGGSVGGIQWGTATDGSRIYVAIANADRMPYVLRPSGATTKGGAWSALDVSTGAILWQTADPLGAIDTGAVSVANGTVYAGSNSGHMYTLSAQTGQIVFDFDSKGAVVDAPSIVSGTVYWGAGYKGVYSGTGTNGVFAFAAAPQLNR